jgi:hypothetical protein
VNRDEAGEIIEAALRLERERTVNPDSGAKAARREVLTEALDMMRSPAAQPTADYLSGLLGDPDDSRLRKALERWDSPEGHTREEAYRELKQP